MTSFIRHPQRYLRTSAKLKMWSTSLLLLQSLHLLYQPSLRHWQAGAASTSPEGLSLLTETSCICPGRQLVYKCTIVGSALQYTVWRGSALDCSSGISLRHGEFMDTGHASGTCNNGAILGRITSISGGRYTSQLIVNTSLNLNGKEVECAFDDGANRISVNTTTIRISTAPLLPPHDVRLIDIQPGRITFNWTAVDTLCDSVSYNIISFNCGTCPPMTSGTTATCIDVVASGQVCTFIIQTMVCGNITGSQASPTSVIMKAPRVSAVHSVPRYNHMTGGLLSISSCFDALDSVTVSDGFEIHVVSYNISYKDSSTGNICGQIAIIPASVCMESGVCKHVFKVSSSFCHPSTDITITVTAMSMFGSGMESDPQTIGSRNQFFCVDFTFDIDTLRITCNYLNSTKTNGEKSCTAVFGLGQDLSNCRNLSQSLKSEQNANVSSSSVSIDLPIFSIRLMSNNMCLIIRASDSRHTVEMERILTVISGCDEDDLSDGSVLPDGVYCGLPLFTAGIKNGIVCYTGTGIGAIATHHCPQCRLSSTQSVRTCLPNGTWNGSVPHCQCTAGSVHISTAYTAISMGVIMILISTILIIVIVLLVRSSLKIRKMLMERRVKEEMQIYEDINLSQIIDSMKNVAYEAPSQIQT